MIENNRNKPVTDRLLLFWKTGGGRAENAEILHRKNFFKIFQKKLKKDLHFVKRCGIIIERSDETQFADVVESADTLA